MIINKYIIICEKCGEERDITKQINSELEFKRKEFIEDELTFLKAWESLFWQIKDCECCKCHKSKLQERIKQLESNDIN